VDIERGAPFRPTSSFSQHVTCGENNGLVVGGSS